jgi:insecticidal toxin complex protein TccC
MRPRVDETFERIEFFTAIDGAASFWRTLDRAGIVHFYGRTEQARVADPANPRRIFEWLLEEVADTKGERALYNYKPDGAARLPANVRYGNATPYKMDWCFEVVFDYGEREECYEPVRDWSERPDPRRSYHAGFEIQSRRRCTAVMLFHRFAELGAAPVLTRLLRLVHDADSRLRRVEEVAFAGDVRQAMPPLELSYREFTPAVAVAEEHAFPPGTTFLDLKGQGVPGVFLDPAEGGPWFWPACADGSYGPLEKPAHWPLGCALLLDITGAGHLDLLRTERPAGFYAGGNAKPFSEFTSFDAFPLDFFAAGRELADLGGTGRQDVVVIGRNTVDVYPSLGLKGYGPRRSFPSPAGLPMTTKTDDAYHAFCAFFGTGGEHRLRVSSNAIEVWPHLGFGRFADKLDVRAPDLGPDFQSARLRLCDIDGSGAPSLAYVRGNTISIYLNRGGVIAMRPLVVTLPAECFDMSQVSFVDIHGRGYDCLVFRGAGTGRCWIWDFCGACKPHLLTGIDNNRGLRFRIRYESSTRWCLLDAERGLPWATTLPFPVTVIAAIESRDDVSGQCSVSSYSYAHGWYDGEERAFRGFGRIDRTHSDNGFDVAAPPTGTLIRTWYHSGGAGDLERMRNEFFSGDPLMWPAPGEFIDPATLHDQETVRQAYATLQSRKLREEIYGIGSDIPFGAVDFSHWVRLERPRDLGKCAVFSVHERERIEYDYERVAADPRISHVFTLEVDEWGETTSTCHLAYPRRPGAAGEIPEQRTAKLVAIHTVCVPPLDGPDVLLFGLLAEQQSFELAPPLLIGDGLRPEALSSYLKTAADGKLLSWEKIHYQPGQQGVVSDWRTAQFSYKQAQHLFGALTLDQGLEDYLRARGGYTLDAGWWWSSGDCPTYDSGKFYLLSALRDPFGTEIHFCYDAYGLLLLTKTKSGPGCTDLIERAEDVDYLLLRARRELDANGIVRESHADAFGRPFVSTRYKLRQESAGFLPLSEWQAVGTASLDAVVTAPADFLQRAMAFTCREDLAWCGLADPKKFAELGLWDDLVAHAWISREGALLSTFHALSGGADFTLSAAFDGLRDAVYARLTAVRCRQPVRETTLQAQLAPETAVSTTILIRAHHLDGLQRPAQVSTLVEPGEAWLFGTDGALQQWSAPRWRSTGAVVYDHNGELRRQYQPCFTSTPAFIERRFLPLLHQEMTIHRDPLGQPIRFDHPRGPFKECGVYETIAYGPWSRESRDTNETIKTSPLYQLWVEDAAPSDINPFEIEALRKATAVSGGATIEHFDNLGHVVQVSEAGLVTRYGLDIEGRELWSADPRLDALGLRNFERIYALGGQVLETRSVDSGRSISLLDAKDRSLFVQDARTFLLLPSYDGLGRPTSLGVRGGDGPKGLDHTIERWIYADNLDEVGLLPIADPESSNMRGRLFRHYDASGLREIGGYDLEGRPKSTTRRIRTAYVEEADWFGHGTWGPMLTAFDAMLRPESFHTEVSYDALGRPSCWSDFSGQTHGCTYALGGGVKQELFAGNVIRELLRYNSNGQPEEILLGNQQRVFVDYAPDTGRLQRIQNRGQFDATYYYDPDGGLTHIAMTSASTPCIDLDYSYDAQRRLVLASGCSRVGISEHEERSASLIPFLSPRESEVYEQSYRYDNGGNVVEVEHHAKSGNWSRRFNISSTSNRAEEAGNPAAFDAGGNLLTLGTTTSLAWNCWNNLHIVTRAGDSEYYIYAGDGQRIRKVRSRAAEGLIEETLYLGNAEFFERRSDAGIQEKRCRVVGGAGTAQFLSWEVPIRPAQQRYQVIDMLGSHVVETDETGAMLTSEDFFPYGTTARAEGDPSSIELKSARHAGRERDQCTGLYYYGHRYYDPTFFRWISPDPSGDSDGLNLYAFVHGDPATLRDISGLGTAGRVNKKKDASRVVAPARSSARRAAAAATKAITSLFPTGSTRRRGSLLTARATEPVANAPTGQKNADFIAKAIQNKSYKQDGGEPLQRIKWKGMTDDNGVTSGIPVYLTSRFGTAWSKSHIESARELGTWLKGKGYAGLSHGDKDELHYAENSHLIAGSLYGCNDELSAPSASVHQNTEWLAIEEGIKQIKDTKVRLKATGYVKGNIMMFARYKIFIGDKKVFDHLSYGLRGNIDKDEARTLRIKVTNLTSKSPAVSLGTGVSKGIYRNAISKKTMEKSQAGKSGNHAAFTSYTVYGNSGPRVSTGMAATKQHQKSVILYKKRAIVGWSPIAPAKAKKVNKPKK